MDLYLISLTLLLPSWLALVKGQNFLAVFRLKQAFNEEERAIAVAEEYLSTKEIRRLDDDDNLRKFESFIQLTKEKHEAGVKKGDSFMEHPVNIYHVMRRMADDWPKSVEYLSESEDKKVQALHKELHILMTNSSWPTLGDRQGVTRQLLMTQAVYLLDIHEMATGTLNGTIHDPLTLDELSDIANYAIESNLYYQAIQWLEGLFSELVRGQTTETINLRRGAMALASAYFRFGNYRKAMESIDRGLNIEPQNERLQSELKYYKEKVRGREEEGVETDMPVVLEPRDGVYARNYHPKYYAMCRGDVKKTENVKRRLRCYLRRTSVPYRPAKTEIVNRDPLIIMFHDVIYEAEMEQIKRMVIPQMDFSKIVVADGSFSPDFQYRVSMTTWLTDETRLVARLSQRISEKTGLSTLSLATRSHAETMQVLNYGIGGMYEPHHDYFVTPHSTVATLEGSGNRMATWMFYINDVRVGGNTVFPISDTTVPVVKGSAAFWPNMFLNGTVDPRTLHAGCPVVIGSKWVMNKWIRESGNFDRWPCTRRRTTTNPSCLIFGRKC